MIVAGDFNCSTNSSFFTTFQQFLYDNQLICSDISRLSDVFTYCMDDGLAHADADVLYGYMCSDHRPLSVGVNLYLHLASKNKSTEPRLQYQWS